MALQITSGDVLVLFVSDLERSRRFYGETLAMEYLHGDERSAVYRTESGILLLLDHVGADDLLGAENVDHERNSGAQAVIVAGVDDVDEAYASLRAEGVEFIRPPEDRWWGMRTAHFRDPDGHVWEVHHGLQSDTTSPDPAVPPAAR